LTNETRCSADRGNRCLQECIDDPAGATMTVRYDIQTAQSCHSVVGQTRPVLVGQQCSIARPSAPVPADPPCQRLLACGRPVPTDEDLMQQFDVSHCTVRAALDVLVADGIIKKFMAATAARATVRSAVIARSSRPPDGRIGGAGRIALQQLIEFQWWRY
jgi:hypothetical protein